MREPLRRFACVALAFALLHIPLPLSAQRRLLDSTDVRTWAALLRTHDARATDTIAIDAALRSHIPELRAAAARIVGMNRVASRYAVLRNLLRSERDSSMASDAAFALGLAADSLSCDALRGALVRPAASIASRGPIRIMLDGVRTPMTADHLCRLAKAGYFRNLRFHRVAPAFVAQGGDPRGDGSGGTGYAIRDELNRSPYVRGAVGMALSGLDTGGSQFFLTLAPQPHLDGDYTVLGRVVAGQVVVDALTQGDAIMNILSAPQ